MAAKEARSLDGEGEGLAVRACLMASRQDADLPAVVLGPVDFSAEHGLAAI